MSYCYSQNLLIKNLALIKALLLFVILVTPNSIAHSCGIGMPSFYGYTFINKEIVPLDIPYAPFLLEFEGLYKRTYDYKAIQTTDNVTEWQERTCPDARKEDIQKIIYKTPLNQIQVLRTAAKNEKAGLPNNLSNNTFARFLIDKKCIETIDYLIFAKQCEPHVIASANAWESPKRDTFAMQELIEKGLKKFKKTDSHYIKLRYAFQLIRLAHYKKNYQQVLDLYAFLLPKTDAHPSLLDYWIMGHRAGALRALGKRVEAAYLYSLIFKNCPSKREQAFRSFSIKSDKEWEQCLLLCKSDAERAVLYTMRANADESKAAEEMQKIYELDPDNENLELLLVEEIEKLEKDYMGLQFNIHKTDNKRHFKTPRKNSEHYLIQLQQLVQQILDEDRKKEKELWYVAEAYLEFLAGDFYAADKSFKRITPLIENEVLKEQIEVFQLALQINMYNEIDTEDEAEIYELMKNDYYQNKEKYPDFHNFLFDKLAYDYQENGELGKAFRTLHSADELKYNIRLDLIEDLLKICTKEDRSRLEEALVSDASGKNIKYLLLDLKGTHYLTKFQLEAALKTFKEIPRAERDTTTFHPYRNEILDCVSCEQTDTLAFDKVALVEKMIDLNYQARADLDRSAKPFYELGLIYYNLSYYGNCWKGMDYFRSGTNWKYTGEDNVHSYYDAPYGNHENKDLSQALFYFEKARLLTNNPELAARSAFMAAKCQHNQWYNEKGNRYSIYSNRIPAFSQKAQTYFDVLKKEYQDTEFYGEAIKECKYFRAYALK